MNRRALLGSNVDNYMLIHFDNYMRNEGYGGYIYNNFGYLRYISDEQSKFGGTSVYINGDRCHYGANFELDYLPLGDYTLEFWMYRVRKQWSNNGYAIVPAVYGQPIEQGDSIMLISVSDHIDKLDYIYIGGDSYYGRYSNLSCFNYDYYDEYYEAYGYSAAADKWCHIAFTYSLDNNQCCVYIAGKKAATFGINLYYPARPYLVFGNSSTGMYLYFDELRVTPRVIYTGNTITVPTEPFEG